jgi:hypothetical protein
MIRGKGTSVASYLGWSSEVAPLLHTGFSRKLGPPERCMWLRFRGRTGRVTSIKGGTEHRFH